ncbi:MAG: DNA repair protein RecO [Candidatus Kapabacteria bacterium]|nr:DNA repair protein RecO [Candidatus Kapabacteria bacterium]
MDCKYRGAAENRKGASSNVDLYRMIVRTDAIVLHSRKYGDTSRIVVLYTQDLGKTSVVAKGVRKPTSQFGSALEPLSHCRTTIYHKPMRDLHTITAAETLTPRRTLRSSYDHLSAALGVCETVMRTQREEEPNAEVFDLLAEGLALLESCIAPYAVGVQIRLQLADVMGFGLPDCGPPPTSMACAVRMTDGLLLHANHAGQNSTIRMATSAYNVLYAGIRNEAAMVTNVNQADQLEIEAFLSAYFSHHLDRRVVSRTFDVMR